MRTQASYIYKTISLLPPGLLALSIFFFLAPGYEKLAICFSFLALILKSSDLVVWCNPSKKKHLLMATALTCCLASFCVDDITLKRHLLEFTFGITVASAVYYTYGQSDIPIRYIFAGIALPLVMHLLFFLPIIPSHLINTEAPFLARFESLRASAQIGTKLLSQALALLIPILYHLLCIVENKYEKFIARFLFSVACLCFALLDSRAGYASMLVGVILGYYAKRIMLRQSAHSESYDRLLCRARQVRRFVLILAVLCATVALAVGWHRLKRIDAAVQAAMTPNKYTSWITPQTWVQEFCPSAIEECKVENSAYLRLSWIIFGTKAIAGHPWRILPTSAPLEYELSQEYPELAKKSPIYTDSHSGVIDAGLNYGVFGSLGFLFMLFCPLYWLFKCTRISRAPDYLPLLFMLWGIIVTRSIIDGVGANLWYIAWAYAGLVIALMSDRRRDTRHAI